MVTPTGTKCLGVFFNFCFNFVFSIWLYFPFNSFFAGISRYYKLYTLCIYINIISSRIDHNIYISSNVSQPSLINSHIYTHMYIYTHTQLASYIQFLLIGAFGASGISLIGAFGAR